MGQFGATWVSQPFLGGVGLHGAALHTQFGLKCFPHGAAEACDAWGCMVQHGPISPVARISMRLHGAA
eukprot:364944-Chlamydomonas_euryale.AAC.13